MTEPGRNDSLQERLADYLAGKVAPDKIAILYHIGDEFSGETDFRLQGDGSFTLWSTVTAGRARRDYTGQVDLEQVKNVARGLLSARVWEVRHVRSIPGDDDPEVRIAIQHGDSIAQAVLWVSELKERPAFTEAQKPLLELIHQVSRGEVLEVGR